MRFSFHILEFAWREKLRLWGTSPYLSRSSTVFFSVHSNLPPFITFCIDMLLLTNRESIFVVDSNIYIVVDRTHREWVAEPTTLTRTSSQVGTQRTAKSTKSKE